MEFNIIDNELYDNNDINKKYIVSNKRIFTTYTPIDNIDSYIDKLIAEIDAEEMLDNSNQESKDCSFVKNEDEITSELLNIAV